MSLFGHRAVVAALLSSVACVSPALAQTAPAERTPPSEPVVDGGDIVVTATKRSETLQSVPIAVQALPTKALDQLNITNFAQYAKQLPSVSFQPAANAGGNPGQIVIYQRGIAAGGEGNHSGSLPAVGVYLDEQPVTTVGGNLDVHIYDVARIESLSGPQGTLFGASSEAGTVRIITNKPDLSHFYGRADVEGNHVSKGGFGGKAEGMLNIPLADNIALRVVGFYQRDAGYIDNVAGTRRFCGGTNFDAAGNCVKDGITVNNASFVKKDYNDTEIAGGRAALKIDLDSNWTVTPTVMYQDTRSHGAYGYDPKVGDLKLQHFLPEYRRDRYVQAALTIEGKVGNWDLTYAGAYLDRKAAQSSDYTDYAEAYDNLYSSVGGLAGYFYYKDNAGRQIAPLQNVVATDHFKKLSQELRVASPAGDRFRIVAGAFYQRQSNDINQDYRVAGLATALSVNGSPGTLWLTQQHRVDKDYAMFGEASFDITPTLTATAGARAFIYDNSLIGFFGFGRNPSGNYSDTPYNGAGSSRTGVAGCFTTNGTRLREAVAAGASTTLAPAAVAGSPCTNLGNFVGGLGVQPVKASGQGVTYRANLSWKPVRGVLLYGTVSRGFRPGGINRRADVAPYAADYLTNYEFGAKTTLLGGRAHINGAIYQEDWAKFQFSYLGANSFTEIHNGPNARVRGIELNGNLNLGGLTLSASGAYNDAKTRQNLCLIDDPTYRCTDTGNGNIVSAPAGTRLPITPRFKGSASARYSVPVGSFKVYGQGVVSHQSSAASDIRTATKYPTGNVYNPAAVLGRLAAFTSADFALGAEFNRFSIELFLQNAFDTRGQIARFQECGSCGQRPYIIPIVPQTVGVRLHSEF
ncbi:TonB-dependent receptor [Sphingomonas glacialis]|uniref:TonB-dependent receptor n=1 Tax=Sphingomonas glacialis TaxID=658225 RepID=A0ABQ3LRV2_9SPHN|nr:TonB-dependent receptor [Sphingomonas glacialis]GHH22914.1 TonB-dependent receptor [Sphingomonas glacialis]